MLLEAIYNKYNECKKCVNCKNDKKVYGTGNIKAKIAIIGESPCKEEIESNITFSNSSGRLLEKGFEVIGIEKKELYFTNTLLCNTDDRSRSPTKAERSNCRERLFEELNLIKPTYTILVGTTALKTVAGEEFEIKEMHGEWITNLSDPCYFYFCMYHPFLIINSVSDDERRLNKDIMWKDFIKLKYDLITLEKYTVLRGSCK